jgi:hypothetical protein
VVDGPAEMKMGEVSRAGAAGGLVQVKRGGRRGEPAGEARRIKRVGPKGIVLGWIKSSGPEEIRYRCSNIYKFIYRAREREIWSRKT